MANPNALFLLADHIKLSLLERQRTKALDLLQEDASASESADAANKSEQRDAQDGHIARSLDQLRDGLAALQQEQARLEAEGEEGKALNIADALPGLQKKLAALTAQFEGAAPVAVPGELPSGSSRSAAKQPKAVRFQDKPLPPAGSDDPDLEAQRAGLFNRPYTDEPEPEDETPAARFADQDNVQLHQMHARIMADQDAQLDALGESIGRQRELSLQIGDELDSQALMLEEADGLTDRHQTRLDRARRQVGRVARSAGGDCKQMTAIIVLIVILVLLIAVLK